MKIKTENGALKMSSGFVNYKNFTGYYPFSAANFLVKTGKYLWQQSTPWGYVLEKIETVREIEK